MSLDEIENFINLICDAEITFVLFSLKSNLNMVKDIAQSAATRKNTYFLGAYRIGNFPEDFIQISFDRRDNISINNLEYTEPFNISELEKRIKLKNFL